MTLWSVLWFSNLKQSLCSCEEDATRDATEDSQSRLYAEWWSIAAMKGDGDWRGEQRFKWEDCSQVSGRGCLGHSRWMCAIDHNCQTHTHTHMYAYIHSRERMICAIIWSHLCTPAIPVAQSDALCVLWLPAAPQRQGIRHWPSDHHRSCPHWYFLFVFPDELGAVVRLCCRDKLPLCHRWSSSVNLFLQRIKQENFISHGTDGRARLSSFPRYQVALLASLLHTCRPLLTRLFRIRCDSVSLVQELPANMNVCSVLPFVSEVRKSHAEQQIGERTSPVAAPKTSCSCVFSWGQKKVFQYFLVTRKNKYIEHFHVLVVYWRRKLRHKALWGTLRALKKKKNSP